MTYTMDKEANAVDKQATVCARMGSSLAQVEAIARARNWRGILKKRLVNRYLNLKAKSSVNPF
jgi:hypothetical protein